MRIKKWYSLLFSFLLLFIYSSAISQTIKIGYVEFPPMTYTGEHGRPAGIIIDITSKSLEKAGFQWTARSLPAKRLAKTLVKGDIHLWIGLTTLPEFKGTTYIGESVVEKLVLRAYTIGERKPILQQQDLFRRTILILRGYSYGGWIHYIKDPANQVTYLEFDSHENAFKSLSLFAKKGKHYYLLDYKHPSEMVLRSHQFEDIQFNDISSFDIHFVVTKNMDGAKAVLEKLEKAFVQLKKEGLLTFSQ
ncbi:MAG: hypothetical protein MI892_10295 [Desulfobacterales bacterium]|nr:hypothetical protein [Desulfobacterales bacterium]